MNSSPPGIRHRATSTTAGDEILYLGFGIESHLLPPVTRFRLILQSHGVESNNDSVIPTSTDVWRCLFIRLSSPPATHQFTAGEFVWIAAACSVVFWSVDLFVIQPYMNICFVRCLLNP
jgi:hypothetical protein